MSDWKNSLKLGDVWDSEDPKLIATKIVERLPRINNCLTEDLIQERDEIIWEFSDFCKQDEYEIEEFDDILARLYDWGDISLDNTWNGSFSQTPKVCFVNTFKK